MKQLYFFLLLLVVSVSAFAQTDFRPGYIQKNDGSRTQGLLDYRSDARNALGIAFKEHESAAPVVYKPGELQGYGFEGSKRYESITFTGPAGAGQAAFMEVLATGTANLYFLKEEQGKERYFLQKDKGPVQELVQEVRRVEQGNKAYKAVVKLYVGTLIAAMQDCPQAKASIEKARLEQSDLIKVLAQYNTCVAPGQANAFQKEADRRIVVQKGIMAGVTMVNAGFSTSESSHTYLTHADFSSSPALTAGMVFDLSMRKVSEKLSLHTGLMYHQYRIEGSYRDEKSTNNYDTYEGYLEASYLKLPLLLRYTYPKGTVRPYLNLGVHYSVLLKAESEVVKESFLHGSTSARTAPALDSYRSFEEGLIGGVGVRVPVFSGSALALEARYEYSTGISPYHNLQSGRNLVSLLVGVTL